MQLIQFGERQERLYSQFQRTEWKTEIEFCAGGVITIYFALILPVILALLAASIQSVAGQLSEVQMKRMLKQAMLSELAKYDRVLYNEYHIFGRDTPITGGLLDVDELETSTNYWLELNTKANQGFLLTDAAVSEFNVTEYKTLTMNYGEEFCRQAIEYMKYKNTETLLEWLLSKMGLFETIEQAEPILKKQLEVTEILADIDEKQQSLMQYIDGILFKDGKIKKSWTGKIQTARRFTKQMVFGIPKAEQLHINNTALFQVLKKTYVDLEDKLIQVRAIADTYIILAAELEKNSEILLMIQAEWNALKTEQAQLIQSLGINQEEKKEILQKGELEEKRLKKIKAELARLEKEKGETEKQLAQIKSSMKTEEKKYTKIVSQLSNLEKDCGKSNQEALQTLSEIRARQKEAEKEYNLLEQLLTSVGEKADSSFLDEIKGEMEWMLGYLDNPESKLSKELSLLEAQLITQRKLLAELEKTTMPNITESILDQNHFYETINKKEAFYENYAEVIPKFDYRWLDKKEEKETGILETIELLIKNGVAEIILKDYKDLSDKTVKGDKLPSAEYNLKSEYGILDWILNFFQNNTISALFSHSESQSLRKAVQETGNVLLDKIMLLSYMEEHFGNYRDIQQNRALNYEIEYLLAGKGTDKENIVSAVNRVLYWRLLANLIYLYTNHQSNMEAREAAIAAVGFTGLAGLVSLTKFLLLTAWGIAAAFIETSAIFMGKQISFFLQQDGLSITLPELSSLSKEKIQQKAVNLKETKLGFAYSDYLRLSLIIQPQEALSLRAMDLIQETLRAYYDSDFFLSNCICKYSSELFCILPIYFFSLPFMSHYFSETDKEYTYRIFIESAY